MPTSGTVAQTQINVATLIDTAFRRAGKQPSTVSGELLGAAQNALYFLCAEMVNRGVNLFCVRKTIIDVQLQTAAYTLPAGTTDVLNALYRTLIEPAGTVISGVDYRGVQLDAPAYIRNVSGTFDVAGSPSLVLEFSTPTGWQELAKLGVTPVGIGSGFASDVQTQIMSSAWRVRDISGNNIAPNTVRFRQVKNEINMAQLNRDDYVNLPNKYGFAEAPPTNGNRGLQYWFDKQINPLLYIWPVNNNADDQIIVYQHGQIEDVGKLSNELAVPPRWYECIIFTLSARLCLEIPPAELPMGRYEAIAAQAAYFTEQAGHGESDGSSYKMTPRIGGYTA